MTKDRKEYQRAYYQANKEKYRTRNKAWEESHKEHRKAYYKTDVNSFGQTKQLIRCLSGQYLKNHGKKIPGYEIHHCFTYDEPYKFIYCSKETHLLIHAYLREHNIDADSDHYEQIKHLLDDTVVLYGINEGDN